jgi:hypothetical protein
VRLWWDYGGIIYGLSMDNPWIIYGRKKAIKEG